MKLTLAITLVSFAISTVAQNDDDWESFKKIYTKSYISPTEESQRRKLWEENYKQIQIHNRGNTPYKYGYNSFMDKNEAEIKKLLNVRVPKTQLKRKFLIRQQIANTTEIQGIKLNLPDKVDYRNDQCSPSVKDQGDCGSSWAFSATYVAEFYSCKKTGKPTVLSEQQLLDCDFYNGGCVSGFYDRAWAHVIETSGMCTSTTYAYTSARSTCRSASCTISASLKTVKYVLNDVNSIMNVIANEGPVSAAIDARGLVFYSSGIYADTACTEDVNHAVNIVGYGTAVDGTPYWVVRSSWGSSWGFKGHALIKRGVNMCGIESHVAYPTV